MHYDAVQNYAMKCRLYPNKTQKAAIDDALTAVRVFHNCLVYDMWNNGINVIEKPKKDKDGNETEEKIHFPDLKKALAAGYKNRLIEEHPIIAKCPSAALITKVGIKADLIKEFGKLPTEMQKPTYYNELHPRNSYSYQETLSKIKFEKSESGTLPHAFRMNLLRIGNVKVRGWNKKLRFEDEQTDFIKWCEGNPKTKITVVVSRDNAGDYFIVFTIKECLKPFAEVPEDNKVGIDVGVKDIAICSDGTKFENKKFKKQNKRFQKLLNRKLSRREGPSNEEYRARLKKYRAEMKKYRNAPEQSDAEPPKPPNISKRYESARKRHAKLNRKIARLRDNYNHNVSRRIVEEHSFIGVESLNIKGMTRNKHLSYALTDAAFGNLLQFIKYKAEWHGRTVKEIDKWTPSSKRCSECGYIYESTEENGLRPWGLGIRHWVCPVCGSRHDRDINAAKNILYFALNENQ